MQDLTAKTAESNFSRTTQQHQSNFSVCQLHSGVNLHIWLYTFSHPPATLFPNHPGNDQRDHTDRHHLHFTYTTSCCSRPAFPPQLAACKAHKDRIRRDDNRQCSRRDLNPAASAAAVDQKASALGQGPNAGICLCRGVRHVCREGDGGAGQGEGSG